MTTECLFNEMSLFSSVLWLARLRFVVLHKKAARQAVCHRPLTAAD
jgi:hypothetical protein